MHLSVIICAHNPKVDYLRRTLEGLEAQTHPRGQWELLLVDNASKTPLAEVFDLSWHPAARHVVEHKLGTSFARMRGIQESRHETVVFVDDDNVLEPDYLERVVRILSEFPQLGYIGAGVMEPEYEIPPPEELHPHLSSLAVYALAKSIWSNNPLRFRPVTAGGALRRRVALQWCEVMIGCPLRQQLGRKGRTGGSDPAGVTPASYVAGEDDEISFVACDMGLGIGLFPELKLTHLISAPRIDRGYLLKIAEGNGFSLVLFSHLHGFEPDLPKASKPADIWSSLLQLKLYCALEHTLNWTGSRQHKPLAKEIAAAYRRGSERAKVLIGNTFAGRKT
jgi:glycosyltransferase involved in cell wall biosynthesis